MAVARYVLDASVAAKWFLPSEELAEIALVLGDDWQQGSISLVAPDILIHEVGHAILKAIRKGGHVPGAADVLGRFATEGVPLYDSLPLAAEALTLALRYNTSHYDGVYLALCSLTGYPMVTADQKLIRAVGDGFPLVTLEAYEARR